MPVFVEDDAGFMVSYLDLTKMTKSIARLAGDEMLRNREGKAAAREVRERFELGAGVGSILKTMKKFL